MSSLPINGKRNKAGHRTRFKIYWEGRLLAIFLYMPNVNIYHPQMNHVHSYFIGGDAETLLRYSQWNDELARQWLAEADYIWCKIPRKCTSRMRCSNPASM